MITCRWLSVEDCRMEDIMDTPDPYTRSRVQSCIRSGKAKEIALGSYLLRQLAADAQNLDPSEITIRHSSEGRPYVDPPELFLTSSHCDGVCAAAVSDSKVGLDLQSVRPFKGETVRGFFTDRDYDFIEKSADPSLEMTRIWCVKEACFKYLSIDHPDAAALTKNLTVSDREAFTLKTGIGIFEERIGEMILIIVSGGIKGNDSVEIKRFEEMP